MAVLNFKKAEAEITRQEGALAGVAAAIEALDLTADSQRIAELTAEIGRYGNAINVARERIEEIGTLLVSGRDADPGGVADALLANLSPRQAAAVSPAEQELQNERETLRSAIRDLQGRERTAHDEVERIRRAAKHRVRDCFGPLIDALEQDARAAAQRIVDAFTVIAAIGQATHTRSDAGDRTRAATRAILGHPGLVTRTARLDVPDVIQALLRSLADKGEALPDMRVPSIVAPI